jgi:hypothetical protein
MITYTAEDFVTIRLQNPPKGWVKFLLSDLTEDILHQICLFRPEKANELEDSILPVFRKMHPYLFCPAEALPETTTDFDELKRLERTATSVQDTKDWLATLDIPSQTEMIVSYDLQTALVMEWSVFTKSYDQFCYYGLHDICVVSVCERWNLLYYHEDIFLFGKREKSV